MPPLVHNPTEKADSPKEIHRASTRETSKKSGLPEDMSDFVSLLMGMVVPLETLPQGRGEADTGKIPPKAQDISAPPFQEGLQEDKLRQTTVLPKSLEPPVADIPEISETQEIPQGVLMKKNESPDLQEHHPGMNPGEETVLLLHSRAEGSPEPAFNLPVPGTPPPGVPVSDPPVPTGAQAHLQSPLSVDTRFPEPAPVTERSGVRFDPQNILEQVGGKIVSWIRGGQGMRHSGDQVIKIQLQPESLGRLEVKISMTDNQISTSIVTESASVRDLIQSHQHWLSSALTEQGFKMSDFSVSVAHQGMDRNGNGNASPWTPSEGGRNGSRDEKTSRRPEWTEFRGMEGRGAVHSLMNGGVNIFV
jgi:flagellar hook-length control protein FliK